VFICGFLSCVATAADWPQWRGPTRDGVSPEVPAQLPAKKLLWQQPLVSQSHAGLVVSGGFLIALCHTQGEDHVRCFNAQKGELLWSYTAKNAVEMPYGPGPRGTPLIHDGKVYSVSAVGVCTCLDLAKGDMVWLVEFENEFKAKLPGWGYCGSPLLVDGKLIVSPLGPDAGIAALNPKTGDVLWQTKGEGQPHSSYIAGTFGEVAQIVGYDGPEIAGWEIASGKKLWGVRPENTGDFNVGTPVNVDGKLLVATENNFTRLYSFEKGGKMVPEPAAKNDEFAPGTASPVYCKNLIFGGGNEFYCLDPQTLTTLWVESKLPALTTFTMVIAGNDRLLVLNEDGNLALIAAKGETCAVLGTMKVCGKTWSHPALANGKLYVRDATTLYCYSMAP
jgi:outer membrane protein assembly factor BamB